MHRVCLTRFAKAAHAAQGPCPEGAFVVRDLLMVAALIDARAGQNFYGISANDDGYLASMIEAGPRTHTWFAPDMRAWVCNIRYQHPDISSDFLVAAHQDLPARPDMVSFNLVSYIKRRRCRSAVDKRLYTQSMRAFEPCVWADALQATGAGRAVNIHGMGDELPSARLQENGAYELTHADLPTKVAGRKMDVLRLRAA